MNHSTDTPGQEAYLDIKPPKAGRGSHTIWCLVAIAFLAGGCNHPNPTTSSAVLRLSQTLVGKRITIRGKLLTFKCGQGIQLDDEEVVCLIDMHPKPISDDPYPEMYDKLVEATGTLRFYHNPTPKNETRQREEDHYYFEQKTTQVRLITK